MRFLAVLTDRVERKSGWISHRTQRYLPSKSKFFPQKRVRSGRSII